MSAKIIRESGGFISRLAEFPHYAEEGQDFPVKFQICYKNKLGQRVILHGPVQCRDFLGDIMCSSAFGSKYNIYGFESDMPVWSSLYGLLTNEPQLRITFPKEEHKKNFLQNFYGVLMLFMYPSADIVQIQSFLDEPNNVVLVDLPSRPTPMFISFFTFLVKIAGQPLQNYPDIVNALTYGEQKRFIELFQQFFPNKDASYFKRVSIDTFKLSNMIFHYAMSGTPFSYLSPQKGNISYLHNNSGFFSQFGTNNYSHDQAIFRRIIGTLASKCGTEVPFKFTPLTDEELHQLVPKTQYNFRDEKGEFWLIKSDQVEKYDDGLTPSKKVLIKKTASASSPMTIDELLSQLPSTFSPATWAVAAAAAEGEVAPPSEVMNIPAEDVVGFTDAPFEDEDQEIIDHEEENW